MTTTVLTCARRDLISDNDRLHARCPKWGRR